MKICNNDSETKITRRDFLKGMAGSVFGAAAVMSLPLVSRADEIISELADAGKVSVTDSLGRSVKIPTDIRRAIPAGMIAQTMMIMLCPEKIAAVSRGLPQEDQPDYIRAGIENVYELEAVGRMYSENGTAQIDESVVSDMTNGIYIDVGAEKPNQTNMLNNVQSVTETPVLFIDASIGNLPDAFRTLGKLLGCLERAETLAEYIESKMDELASKRGLIEQDLHIMYAANELGIKKHITSSFQNDIIEFLGFLSVDITSGSIKNEIDTELLPNALIDYVVFNSWECFKSISACEGDAFEIWKSVEAIKQEKYAVAPGLFHSWIGSQVLVQSIGAIWLGNLIAPDVYDFDMVSEAKHFYDLFYNYELTDEEAEKLLGIYIDIEDQKENIDIYVEDGNSEFIELWEEDN